MLVKNPQGFTGRELGALCKVSPFKINQVLRHLVQNGIVTETVVGRAHLYRLNAYHILVRELIVGNLRFEEEILRGLGAALWTRLIPPPLAIILYGSVARGEEEPRSDLDLLLIYADNAPPDAFGEQRGECALWLAQTYGMPGMLTRMIVSEIQRRAKTKDGLVPQILKEGTSIAGLTIAEVLQYDCQKN
ncbi:MAG: nucleotidyltransferase domain-containing protein [Deltaproteobacteria bacterium]|nr:nucleotidyltransferase domain-containing protein [Deltaproteobacteria bacterium]